MGRNPIRKATKLTLEIVTTDVWDDEGIQEVAEEFANIYDGNMNIAAASLIKAETIEIDLDEDDLLNEVSLYAERLVEAGDLAGLEAAFGTRDPDFDLGEYTREQLAEIYNEFIAEEKTCRNPDATPKTSPGR